MLQIFLDCDGVLADFNSLSFQIFNQDSRLVEDNLGTAEFWRRIRSHGSFYRDLPLLPDALELYNGVRHLNPVILTGCPEGGWAEAQKVEWAKEHFPGVEVITCRSSEKRRHMKPGDVLIDDYEAYRHLWEEAGGIFILHTSARDSLDRLAAMSIRRHTHMSGACSLHYECPNVFNKKTGYRNSLKCRVYLRVLLVWPPSPCLINKGLRKNINPCLPP